MTQILLGALEGPILDSRILAGGHNARGVQDNVPGAPQGRLLCQGRSSDHHIEAVLEDVGLQPYVEEESGLGRQGYRCAGAPLSLLPPNQ